jgi:chemotaxis protein methyltransferase CheR
MRDSDCVEFLQRALPRLGMRWAGFRRVRKQVCKRVGRRMKELNLPGATAYCGYLETNPAEWTTLDALCRIPISRFHRGIGVFETLRAEILPELAACAKGRGDTLLRFWSAGGASGEEPYTLAAIWKLALEPQFPDLSLSIVATDADPHMLQRCRDGRFSRGSLKDFPQDWLPQVFAQENGVFVVRQEFRRPVQFLQQDMREETPTGLFDLICCRNVAFTYFDEALQCETLQKIVEKLQPGGRLVIGQHERLPFLPPQIVEERPSLKVYRQVA